MALVPVEEATTTLPAIVEVYNDVDVVNQTSPDVAEVKRPVKVRRIDTYFRPIGTVLRRDTSVADPKQESAASSSDRTTSSAASEISKAHELLPPSIISNASKLRSPSPDVIIEKKHPFIPPLIQRQKQFNSSIACLGCNKLFLCHKGYKNGVKGHCPEISYYNHCYECDAYRLLDLMVECNACYSVFLDSNHFDMHMNWGGGTKGQGCRVNAERNYLKFGCQTTALDTRNKRYFEIPIPKDRKMASPEKSPEVSPSKRTGVLAIGYLANDVTSPVKVSKSKSKNSKKTDRFFYMSDFRVFAPSAPPNCSKTTVPCEGCNHIFEIQVDESNNVFDCKQLYEHCIFSCSEYRKGLEDEDSHPVACLRCMTYFIDRNHFKQHMTNCKRS